MPIMLRSCRCKLYGKDEEELARYVSIFAGKCPLDPGGYFVIKGAEKVILIQEQPSKNRIIIDTDQKGCIRASVTSSSDKIKSKTVLKMEKGKINLYLNQFTSKVPIMVVLRAMGMESDQEIIQMIGRDPRYSELLLPSIEDCVKDGVHTRLQALKFLEQKVKKYPYSATSEKVLAHSIIRDTFLANVPVHEENFRPKCIYVAVMLRRMMEAILNKDTLDDKDLFKTMNDEARKKMDMVLTKSSNKPFYFTQYISRNDRIIVGLERAFSTGNWDVKRFHMHRKGMTEVVVRLSYIAL